MRSSRTASALSPLPNTALPATILSVVWQGIPIFALMLLAALQGVSTDMYEAADIDGATFFQKLFRIICRGQQQKIPQIPDKIIDKLSQLPSLHYQLFQAVNTGLCVLFRHCPEQIAEHGSVHSPQDLQHVVIGQQLSEVKGHALIQKAQRVSHGAVSRLCNVGQSPLLHLNLLRFRQLL